MIKSLVLAASLLASTCLAFDAFIRIDYQSSEDGQHWTTIGTTTFSMYATNAMFFNGWGAVSTNQPEPGTRYADIIVMCGTNLNAINTPFLTVSNFPFLGTSNTVYRPNLTMGVYPHPDTNDYPAVTNNPPPLP